MPWRVVIVDDDEAIRSLLAVVLRLSGDFTVAGEAVDGLAALDVVASEQPDLVLLDWQMPRLDGIAALAEIRKVAPDAAVVMMSASAPGLIEQRALSAGADGFYRKAGIDVVETLVHVLTDVLTRDDAKIS